MGWIADQLPPHDIYLEPFFGSGAVFFTKPESRLEVINDIDGQVVNFFKVCRDMPDELARALDLTPYARAEYEAIQEKAGRDEIELTGDPLEDARRFAVRCWMGTGTSLGERTGWKNDVSQTRAAIAKHTWAVLPERIAPIAARLKRAQIENADAVALVEKFNAENVLIYADPPYLGSTRRAGIYRHEMTAAAEHEKLLAALKAHRGPVVLSGYDNDLYNTALQSWHKYTATNRDTANNERLEVIWCNFERERSLFDIAPGYTGGAF